jgi:hypothetical protein
MLPSLDRPLRACALLVAIATLSALALAPAAGAQDRVYWTEYGGPASGLSFAALDGSGGGTLAFPDAKSEARTGLTVDSAAGRFYWTDQFKIESIAFDGSGQRPFDSGGITIGPSFDLSIDPAGRRLIWTQSSNTAPIEIARLDGSGGGPLSAPGTMIYNMPSAVFDPALGRVYWTDGRNAKPPLDYAAIDGSGGAALPLEGLRAQGPVAIDNATGRIFWVGDEGKIHSANFDGSNPADLKTLGATVAEPTGLAIDEATGTVYWGNRKAHALSFVRLDGSAAGDVNIAGSLPGDPSDLVLLVAPRSLAAPRVSGTASAGAILTCSPGEWAPDQPQANLFDATRALAYGWTRDGLPIAGAEAATLTVPAAGSSYGCTVTASNAAGSATARSAPFEVPAPTQPPSTAAIGFGAATGVTLTLAPGKVHGAALPVTIENFNSFAVDGSLDASPVAKRQARLAAIGAQPFAVGAGSTAVTTLLLPPALLKALRTTGKLGLRIATTVADPLGARREVATVAVATAKRVKPKHPRPKHPKPKHHRKPSPR